MKTLTSIIILFSIAFANSPAMATEENKLTLVYTGNLNGELEPCGCTKEGDLGGIRRQATMLARLRKQAPGLFLISSGGLLANDSATDRIKNKYILKGIHKHNYDAIGVQARDLVFGPNLLLSEPLPWVASNQMDDRFKFSRKITHNQVTLELFSWMAANNTQLPQMQGKHAQAGISIKQLSSNIRQAKQLGYVTVLATTQTLAQLNKVLDLQYIDILLIEAAHEVYGQAQRVGQTLVLQPGSRGMRLGLVKLQLNKHRRIQSYQHQIIELPTSIPEATDYATWYENYNAELKQDYLKRVELRKATDTGNNPYSGAEKCQACHQQTFQRWQQSQHAQAFASLEKVRKSFDPNCIGCHTVGFDKSGGFMDEHITPQLMHVQCESCHGAAGKHVSTAGNTPTPNKQWSKEKICRQCHIGSHSPSFTVKQYWPKIKH